VSACGPTPRATPTPTARAWPHGPPPRPVLYLGTASGSPGDRVSFSVALSTGGFAVAGVEADVTFDSVNTPIAVTADGTPDCTVNPLINKEASAFRFQPPGCAGAACTAVRALVFSLGDTDPIPDGSTLYTCNVSIAPSALPGVYALTATNVSLSDPYGAVVPGVTAYGSAIFVGHLASGSPVPIPTSPPGETPTPALAGATVFPLPATPTPTATPTEVADRAAGNGAGPSVDGGGDGCHIGARHHAGDALCLFPAVLLLLARKGWR